MAKVAPLFVLIALVLIPLQHLLVTPLVFAGDAEIECDSGAFATSQLDIPEQEWNEVYVTFNVSRELDFVSPGSWSLTIDWGDGSTSGPYDDPSQTSPGPDADTVMTYYNPRKQAIDSHVYDAAGTYQVQFLAEGQVNEISDGSGATLDCVDDYDNEVILIEPGATGSDPPPGAVDDVPIDPSDPAGAGDVLPDTSSGDGGSSNTIYYAIGGILLLGAVSAGVWMRRASAGALPGQSAQAPQQPGDAEVDVDLPPVTLIPVPDIGTQQIEQSDDGTAMVFRGSLGEPTTIGLEEDA